MKKLLSYALLIAIVIVSMMATIAYFTPPKKVPNYSDAELRELAINKGHKAMPSSLDELISLVDDASNPMTQEKITLGEELFFDTNLSKSGKTSCATCHSFDRDLKNSGALLKMLTQKEPKTNDCAACHLRDQSGVDRFTFSQGDRDTMHPHLLNTQTILNTAFAKHFTWSGEVKSIREQSANSLLAHHKLNMTKEDINSTLAKNPKYKKLFAEAFEDGITFDNTAKAIEVYVKTLVTRGAYDKFLDGDDTAMSQRAKRGLANFINHGCKGCHAGRAFGGESVQRFPLREFAQLYDVKPNFEVIPTPKRLDSEFPFENNGGYLGKGDAHLFRVPILRNVTKTSPYFHNGAVPKIREAVDIMGRHQLGRHLTLEQIDEIVAFLKTLEGDIVDYRETK
ncbi:MAG: cytochrome c peroxidase [Sulfurimonas sp.]|uniref:cytochrome-c peroxidase n=1 Tax=Sulfurimonas sp. TaxID=2022749 RepID=UPI00261F66F1|nr:cytochrome c peroxidase [Sulfurimonas sp.]MDD2653352.1 cytochrome c peroxidase [Sulfurimonas sp.]MDD3450800.1 cytochrome c peroxidase [Sulfurimonas sp.]